MKKFLLLLFIIISAQLSLKAQTDIPDAGASSPMGTGSWIRFLSGGSPYYPAIVESWGINIIGSVVQPVKIRNTSLLVGYTSSNQDFGSGNGLFSGSVGIGTSSPVAKLDVQGGSINTSSSLYIGDNNQGNSNRIFFTRTDNNHYIYSTGTTGNNLYFGEYLDGGAQGFHWVNTQSGKDVMTINGSGNAGIGAVPDSKLTVGGTIHATAVKVDQSVTTPDYVFDKDYELATLKDVKTYIDQNHHLPEIPSAAQVAKEGINLGEMNAKLLKKIEELTLYLIEQKEDVENIKKANKKLELKVKKLESKLSK